MMPTRSQTAFFLASTLAGVGLALCIGTRASERPNLVLIVVDTLRADAISTELGNPRTPNIAELAKHGVAFSRAFAHAPMTLPSHASLFSGLHPFESGVYNNGQAVPADLPLLAETLHAAGYTTRAVVSLATLWPQGEGLGLDRGFDSFDNGEFEVSPAERTSARFATALDSMPAGKPFFLFAHLSDPHEPYNQHTPWFDGKEQSAHATAKLDGVEFDSLTTSSMSYWEADVQLEPGLHTVSLLSASPFLLRRLECTTDGVSVEPHWLEGELLTPSNRVQLQFAGPPSGERSVRLRAWVNDAPESQQLLPRYASEVRAADAAVGELIRELKRRGQWENTLVVLTADHGEALGEHGTVGHVVNLYDELLAVPLVVRLPHDRRDEGLEQQASRIVRHVDVLPTVLEALDLHAREPGAGESLFEVHDRLLIAETHPPEAPRTLIAMRDDTYKMVFDPLADSFEMYRLGPDPRERDNVFGHQGHLRESWQLVLRRLARDVTPDEERDEQTQRKLTALGY